MQKESSKNVDEFDVLDRIQFFLDFKHWSLYKLAKESGVPYSSLNNIFIRKTCPTIITLEKICNGLGITMSDFFDLHALPPHTESITTEEQEILNAYKSLSSKDKELLQAYLRGLCKK